MRNGYFLLFLLLAGMLFAANTNLMKVRTDVDPTANCQNVAVQPKTTGTISITPAKVDNGSSDACGIAILTLDEMGSTCVDAGANTLTLTVTDNNMNIHFSNAPVTETEDAEPLICPEDIAIYLNEVGNASINLRDLIGPMVTVRDTFFFTGGLQSFTVPTGVSEVTIEAAGADGGDLVPFQEPTVFGGDGAFLSADFSVNDNEELQIVVGEMPSNNGGGGGTFIARGSAGFMTFQPANTLLIAGGGGGGTEGPPSFTGGSSTVLQNDANGGGGGGGFARGGGGGASLLNNGGNGSLGPEGGTAIVMGGVGGALLTVGGFGGGGGGFSGRGGGGGGGASGGKAGIGLAAEGNAPSSGGTSFSAGTNTSAITANPGGDGNGFVIISYSRLAILEANATFAPSTFTCADLGMNTVTATVADDSMSSCNFVVTVVDAISPFAICQNIEVFLDASGIASIIPANVDNGSNDNCGVTSMTVEPNMFDCDDIDGNPNMVTLTVFDAAGNFSSCMAEVTVRDTPPSFTCPADQNVNLNENCQITIPKLIDGLTGTANCGTVTFTQNPTAGTMVSSSHNAIVNVTVTANDGNGNTSECTVTLTITDFSPPTLQCFNQTIIFNGEYSIALNDVDLVEADDNCGIQSINLSPNSISSNQVGQIVPVAVTVTDVNGNSATCTSQITVGGLPAGWSQNSNGVGCADGNNIDYNASNGTWTATSTNCYYTPPYISDASAFAQHSLCGDGSITAQVTGITGTSFGWAGVVIRETNAPGAKKAQLTTNMSNFCRREFRVNTGGTAFPQQFPSQNRRWLRIVRTGNQFAMFVSHNGATWSFAGAQNIQMNSCIEIGLVVTNYSSNSTVAATFANVNITGGNSQPIINDGAPAMKNIDSNQSLRDVKVYPNPTSGELNIALTGYEGRSVTLEVYNTVGQMLYTKNVDEVQNLDEIIDLSFIASGMYLIRVSSDGLPAEMKRVTVAR